MHLMLSRQRVVRLLAASVVATEGVGPDEVLGVLHAKTLRAVVGVRYHVLAAQSLASAHAVGGHVTLILDVLEVIRALVAVLVLHPRDGSFAGLRHLLDAAGGAYHLRLFGVELLRVAVVADDLLTLGHRLHQRIVAPILDVHAEALQQLVGMVRECDVADDLECVAVVLVGDVGTRLLRPLHVVEPVLQLPSLQPHIIEIRVALVLHRPCLLVQRIGRVSPHNDVELMARRACIRDGAPVDGRHEVGNLVILPGDELPPGSHLRHLLVGSLDGFHLWAQVVILTQRIHGDDLGLILQARKCCCHILS